MANTVDCENCNSAAAVLAWEDEETGRPMAGLWCEFCGTDVPVPPWLRLELILDGPQDRNKTDTSGNRTGSGNESPTGQTE